MVNTNLSPIVEIVGLTKQYKKLTAVCDLNLSIYRGDILGLIGPNGAGKTTTIRMISGLVKPSHGHIRIFGHSVQTKPQAALKNVGFMIEGSAFYPHLSGYDNLVVYSQLLNDITQKEVWQQLDFVGLSHKDIKRPFKEYSAGMKRRLSFAALLLSDPKILFLDEPTNDLDPLGIQWAHQLVKGLSRSGKTILFSSHQLHDIQRLCNRVAFINQGNLVLVGNTEQVIQETALVTMRFENPEKVKAFLFNQKQLISFTNTQEEFTFNLTDISIEDILKLFADENLFPNEVTKQDNLEKLFLGVVNERRRT